MSQPPRSQAFSFSPAPSSTLGGAASSSSSIGMRSPLSSVPFGGLTPIPADRSLSSTFLDGEYFGVRAPSSSSSSLSATNQANPALFRATNSSHNHAHGNPFDGVIQFDPSLLTPAAASHKKRPRVESSGSTSAMASGMTATAPTTMAMTSGAAIGTVTTATAAARTQRAVEGERAKAKAQVLRLEREMRREKARAEAEARRGRELEEEVARLRREKQKVEMEAVRARQMHEAAMDKQKRDLRDAENKRIADKEELEEGNRVLGEEIRALREALELKGGDNSEDEDDDDEDMDSDEESNEDDDSYEAERRRSKNRKNRRGKKSSEDGKDSKAALEREVRKLQASLEVTEARLREAVARAEDQEAEIQALHEGSAVSGRLAELNSSLNRADERESTLRMRIRELERQLEQREDDSAAVEALRAQVRKLETQRDGLVQMEAECSAMKAERREWADMFTDLIDDARDITPSLVFNAMRELQSDHLKLSHQFTSTKTRLAEASSAKDSATKTIGVLEKQLSKARQDIAEYADRTAALEKQNLFLDRERSALLRVIDTVGDEPYATMSKANQDKVAQEREQRRADLDELRENLKAAHKRIEELEDNSNAQVRLGMSPAVAKQRSKQVETLEARVDGLEKEKKSLEKRLDEALDRLAELEHDEAAGVVNPSKTKVLHLTFNPERKARGVTSSEAGDSGEVSALRAEIAELKAKLEAVGNGNGSSSSAAGVDPMKRHERLKNTFKEWTRTFKEAVYLLTGLKIDMMENDAAAGSATKILRAKSMFAERSSDELRFRWNTETDAIELLETDFAQRIDQDVFAYLSNFKSVPAFLAQLQSDLFSRQTVQI
eukprot:CAMPEP_0171550458 /NCGR_PEP_ID=MMETSP0960-20121227/7077_1 /TAXON_ID=87120 /ORGANISM="Aurantiochytrium limacinum, Strain ATCCMYA-1381" /LENGTH=840 /DNA_ID=CAMNT_0012099399 /DNA_START=34 /DNA_END=2555 /DNA_ORIENTATION=+